MPKQLARAATVTSQRTTHNFQTMNEWKNVGCMKVNSVPINKHSTWQYILTSTSVVTWWMFFFLTSFFCFLFSFLFSRYCSNGVKPPFLSFSLFWTSSSVVSFSPTPHETSISTSPNFFCCSCSSIPCSKARYLETGSTRFSFAFSSSSWTASVKYQLT